MIEQKEWHEGFVAQFHKSGKHYIEFRTMGEKRWLTMTKTAFYIVERPYSKDMNEFKEDEAIDTSPSEVKLNIFNFEKNNDNSDLSSFSEGFLGFC